MEKIEITTLIKFDKEYKPKYIIDFTNKGYYIYSNGDLYKNNIKLSDNSKNTTGYIVNTLTDKNGKQYTILRHQIVAQYFHKNTMKIGKSVDHIDRNILNNNADNIRWATRKQQTQNSKNKFGTNLLFKDNYLIPLEIYNKIKIYNLNELNNFISNLKNSEDIKPPFIKIPKDICKPITNDIDKIIFIITIHFTNYCKLHNILRLTPNKFRDLFWLDDDYDVVSLFKTICIKSDFIKIEYNKPELIITRAN